MSTRRYDLAVIGSGGGAFAADDRRGRGRDRLRVPGAVAGVCASGRGQPGPPWRDQIVAERGTGRLLGAHVATEGAGDVIATAVYALANAMTVHQIADLWSTYLTMAEGLKFAAQSFTRDVSKLSCCAY